MCSPIFLTHISFESCVKNSYEFQQRITSQKVEDGCAMVSFDEVSLFTNSPISDIRNIINERRPEIQQNTSVSKPFFIDMFDLCTQNCYFKHDTNLYTSKYLEHQWEAPLVVMPHVC